MQQQSGSEFVMIFPTALAAIPLLKNICIHLWWMSLCCRINLLIPIFALHWELNQRYKKIILRIGICVSSPSFTSYNFLLIHGFVDHFSGVLRYPLTCSEWQGMEDVSGMKEFIITGMLVWNWYNPANLLDFTFALIKLQQLQENMWLRVPTQ